MLNFVQQVFFLLSTEGSLVIIGAYQPYTLVGPPVRRLVLDPLAVYTLKTVYISAIYIAHCSDPRNFL